MKRHNLIITVVMVLLLSAGITMADVIVPGGNASPVPGLERPGKLSLIPVKGPIQAPPTIPPTVPGGGLPPAIVVPDQPVDDIAPEILGTEDTPGSQGPEWKRAIRLFKPVKERYQTKK